MCFWFFLLTFFRLKQAVKTAMPNQKTSVNVNKPAPNKKGGYCINSKPPF